MVILLCGICQKKLLECYVELKAVEAIEIMFVCKDCYFKQIDRVLDKINKEEKEIGHQLLQMWKN